MPKYRLHGKCNIYQYCHIEYPTSTGLAVLTRCPSNGACAGHWITRNVDEIVEARDKEDAIDNSLSQYEYKESIDGDMGGLEPTWCSHPACEEVKESEVK